MTRTFAGLMLLLLATAAAAAEEPRKAVFITQESIDVAARETVRHPPRKFEFDLGEVVYQNRYGRAHFAYLPFLREFYTAERAYLEREQLYGKARADKYAQPGKST